MNKSENSVMENSIIVTKIQTSGSKWINREDKVNFFQRPLGCAYAIDDMASVTMLSTELNTHTNGTGEAGIVYATCGDNLEELPAIVPSDNTRNRPNRRTRK